MNFLKRNLTTIILVLMGVTGLGLILYPSFADWWNSFHQSRAIASYAEAVANTNREKYDEILQEAFDYNAGLFEIGQQWILTEEQEEVYNSILDITGSGIMGYIDIPKINVSLPIYHGTDEAILQIAIGHLSGTSLPVGGESTHCVVSGHRGLPSAKLFTDIDKLVAGDTWTMTILDYTVTYEVDQIRVVEPTDLSSLQIEEGKDYCSLVTCTPYGINTHRLLVRGHRVENAAGEARVIADALQIESIYVAPFIAGPMILFLFIVLMVSTSKRARERRRRRTRY